MSFFIYLIIVLLIAALLLILNFGLSSFLPDVNKIQPFECGFVSYQQTRESFDISFYIVGILFLLFDIEISFIYPLLSNIINIDWNNLISLILFLGLLSLGLVYEIAWSLFNIYKKK